MLNQVAEWCCNGDGGREGANEQGQRGREPSQEPHYVQGHCWRGREARFRPCDAGGCSAYAKR